MGEKHKVGAPSFMDPPKPMDVSRLLQGLLNMRRAFSGGRPPKYDDRKLAAVHELLRRSPGWSAERSCGWITDNIGASESTIKRAGRLYRMMREYSSADLAQIADDYIKQACFTPEDLEKLRAQYDSLGPQE